jgi:hypothetical protein
MMGIPIDGPAWIFGDSQSAITSSRIRHSNLNKRHNALSYLHVREAISAQILHFIHIDGRFNPSEISTKFLSWTKFWPVITSMLFWKGETIKGVYPNLPITQIIEQTKHASPSGLRGVTSTNQFSASCKLYKTNGNKAARRSCLTTNKMCSMVTKVLMLIKLSRTFLFYFSIIISLFRVPFWCISGRQFKKQIPHPPCGLI